MIDQQSGQISDDLLGELATLRWGSLTLTTPLQTAFLLYSTWVIGQYSRLGLRQGDIVLDAGANFGDFTTYAARRVGAKGHVYAVEPIPFLAKLLKRNLRENRLTNVTVIEAALTGTRVSGRITLDLVGGSFTDRDESGSIEVNCINLDQFQKRFDVIKLDIEGAETGCLLNSSSWMTCRELAIETHDPEGDATLRTLLLDQGFRIRDFGLPEAVAFSIAHIIQWFPSFVRLESQTGMLALRTILRTFQVGRSAIPSLGYGHSLRVLHAARADGSTKGR